METMTKTCGPIPGGSILTYTPIPISEWKNPTDTEASNAARAPLRRSGRASASSCELRVDGVGARRSGRLEGQGDSWRLGDQ